MIWRYYTVNWKSLKNDWFSTFIIILIISFTKMHFWLVVEQYALKCQYEARVQIECSYQARIMQKICRAVFNIIAIGLNYGKSSHSVVACQGGWPSDDTRRGWRDNKCFPVLFFEVFSNIGFSFNFGFVQIYKVESDLWFWRKRILLRIWDLIWFYH